MIKRSFFSLIVMMLVAVEAYALDIEPPVGYEDFVFTIDSTIVDGGNATPGFLIRTSDSEDYNYTVECDDHNPGTNSTNATGVTGDHWCEYATEDTYTIRISGTFPRIYFFDEGGAPYAPRLLSVEQWGTTAWTSMANAFRGCTNMQINANASPDLTNVTSMYRMFSGATLFNSNSSIGNWDTSHVTNMFAMFYNAREFNQDIGDWNTSSVTSMEDMFMIARSFNQDISGWDTSSVRTMNEMFRSAYDFNQDISTWDTSNVRNMSFMFAYAYSFNQSLASWNVEKVINMRYMFSTVTLDTRNYDAILISWNAQNVKSGVEFHGGDSHYCYAASERAHLVSADDWNITDAGLDCTGTEDFIITVKTDNNGTSSDTQFTIPTIGGGYNYTVDCDNDGSNEATAQTGDYTCNYATAGTYTIRIKDNEGDDTGFPRISFNGEGDKEKIIDINQWGSGKWDSMQNAFRGCTHMQINTYAAPNLSNVTNMSQMFLDAKSFNQDIGNWDTSNVIYMQSMFMHAETFNQNISDWNTSAVTSMFQMFTDAKSFNQDISGWDTSNVTQMWNMFDGASHFNQNLENWNVSSLEEANFMLHNSGMSTANYDALLIGWNAQNLKSDVNLSAGGIHYCNGESARANMIASDGWNITDGGKECVADYEVALSLDSAIVINNPKTINFLVRMTETNHGNNEGDVVLSINKNNKLALTYDTSLETMSGKTLSNADWEWTETVSSYRLKYIGNATYYPEFIRMYIGVSGIFTPPDSAKGKFPLTIKLRNGSGDTTPTNNIDSDSISYSKNN